MGEQRSREKVPGNDAVSVAQLGGHLRGAVG